MAEIPFCSPKSQAFDFPARGPMLDTPQAITTFTTALGWHRSSGCLEKEIENIGSQTSDLRDRLRKTMISNTNLLGNKMKINSTSKCPWRINARNPPLILSIWNTNIKLLEWCLPFSKTILHVRPKRLALVSWTIWSPGPKHETQHGFCNHMVVLTQHAHTYTHTCNILRYTHIIWSHGPC